MTAIASVLGAALVTAAGTVAASAITGGGSAPKIVAPPQVQTKPNTAVADALTARRGSYANNRTGMGGAEATGTGTKTKLGA